MHFLHQRQAGQILQVLVGVGQRQFTVQVGVVAHDQHLLGVPAVALQQRAQRLHILLHRGFVGGTSRPGLEHTGQPAIGRRDQTDLDLLFVRRRVVGEAIVHQVAVGIVARHDQRGQVVEQHRQVNPVAQQGLTGDVLPNGLGVCRQRIERAAQPVVIELRGGHAQVITQHRLRQPIHHAIQRARRDQAIEDEHQRHRPVIDGTLGRAVAIDDRAHLHLFQQQVEHRQRPQIACHAAPRQHRDDLGQGAAAPQSRQQG